MEAVPRLPMTAFELKTSETRANFSIPFKSYLKFHHGEKPSLYAKEIGQLDSLRCYAVKPALDVVGCATLKKYYCQLCFASTRFAMKKNGLAAVHFSWKDPYTDQTSSAADIVLEMGSILYNIGALHTKLGAAANRSTDEGIKMANTHFQCAAFAIKNILDEYPQYVSYGANIHLIKFMTQLCLAQGQECILEKSMMDCTRKANTIAKVAVGTADCYKECVKKLTDKDASLTDSISSKLLNKWTALCKFKATYYSSVAYLYQGQQAEEQQKMGERVAYYQAAFDKLEEAGKLSKGLDNIEVINETLQFTNDVVEGKRKAAKKQNEFIYFEDVPQIESLEPLSGAILVKPMVFSIMDPEISGPDIFSALVPMKVHEAASKYSEKLTSMLRDIHSKIEGKDAELRSVIDSMHDAEEPLGDGWGLPQELIDRCADLDTGENALLKIEGSLSQLHLHADEIDGMLKEINEILEQETLNHKNYEDIVGERPPSIAATDLTHEAVKYTGAHQKALKSNEGLSNALELHKDNFNLLSLPVRELEQYVPTIEYTEEEVKAYESVVAMRHKVNEMIDQRVRLENQLKEAVSRDDITQQLLIHGDEGLEELFEEEMAKHDQLKSLIEQNLVAQSAILRAVEEAHMEYAMVRPGMKAKSQRREDWVQMMIYSCGAFNDFCDKIDKGMEFYEKFMPNVSKLLTRVRSTCKVLQEERQQMLDSISKMEGRRSSSPPIENVPPKPSPNQGNMKLKDYLNIKRETGKLPQLGGDKQIQPSLETMAAPGIRPAPVGSEFNSYIPPGTEMYTAEADQYLQTAYAPAPWQSNAGYQYSSYQAPSESYQPYNSMYSTQYSAGSTGYPPVSTNNYQQYQPVMPSQPSQMTYNESLPSGYYQPPVNPPPEAIGAPLPSQQPTVNYSNVNPTVDPNVSLSSAYMPPNTSSWLPNTDYSYTVGYSTVSAPSSTYPVQQNNSSMYDYSQATYSNSSYSPAPNNLPAVEQGQNNQPGIYTNTQNYGQMTPMSSNTYYNTQYTSSQQNYNPTNYTWAETSPYSLADSGTLSPPTYSQAGWEAAPTNTTNSSDASKSSSSVKSSNVDLLAGLDFDVGLPVLTPQTNAELKPKVEEKTQEVVVAEPVPSPPPLREEEPVPMKIEKEPIKEPNAETLQSFKVEVNKFEKFVAGLTVKTLGGPTNLDLKWKEVTDIQEKECHIRSISVARCYPMKNRFPDILPFDESRVELPSTKDDYINASLLQPLTKEIPPLILTQAPITATVADFWTMVIEKRVEVIISLVNETELTDNSNYLPKDKMYPLTLNAIKVNLQTLNRKAYWVERVISVSSGSRSSVVVHLQFTSWPASSFPSSTDFVSFVKEAREVIGQQRNRSHPVIVHCVSGVGRSGALSLLLATFEAVEKNWSIPEVLPIITRISSARKNSLRDRDHLKFAYECILQFCKDALNKYNLTTATDNVEPQIERLSDQIRLSLDLNQEKLNGTTKPEIHSSSVKEPVKTPSSDPLNDLDPLWTLKK